MTNSDDERGSYRMYTAEEVAERWNCDVQFVLDRRKDGSLDAINLNAGKSRRSMWRFPPESVTRYEQIARAQQHDPSDDASV